MAQRKTILSVALSRINVKLGLLHSETRLGDGNLIDLHETLATRILPGIKMCLRRQTWLNFNELQLSCCRDHWYSRSRPSSRSC